MVFAIFGHALKMIFNNLGAVVRISSPIIVLIVAQMLLVGTKQPTHVQYSVADLIWQIVTVAVSLWVAVAWHRYVLLAELPTGVLPRLHLPQMGLYFLWGLGLAVIVWGPVMGVIWIGFQTDSMGPGYAIVVAILTAVLAWVGVRLWPILPAVAIGRPLGLRAAWQATRPFAVGLIGLLILIGVSGAVLSWLVLAVMVAAPMLGAVLVVALQWLYTMFILSILTTLYGVYVEGREID